MNKERLQLALDRLKVVAADPVLKHHFTLSVFSAIGEDCATHMCICGWATTEPKLAAQGLVLGSGTNQLKNFLYYEDFNGFEAAERFFEISSLEAEYLFSPSAYSSRLRRDINYAIQRLEKFISDGETDYGEIRP